MHSPQQHNLTGESVALQLSKSTRTLLLSYIFRQVLMIENESTTNPGFTSGLGLSYLEHEEKLAAVEDEGTGREADDEGSLSLHHRRGGGDRHQASQYPICRHERIEAARRRLKTTRQRQMKAPWW